MLTHHGYYKQIDGLAMGSVPAPYLANIWLSKYDPQIKGDAALYERYMDDVLTARLKDKIEEHLEKINSFHPMLKFTMERELEGRLPFLDLCIVHAGSEVYTTWYTKPTDTGLVMNFHSLAPRMYKRAVNQGHSGNQYSPEMYDPIIATTL